ncbi:hypothetical protein AC579_2306 [Pseudocercospora musae]|uniref:Uncharacterized protein n=1 Tax=Pseudocercospora musae TaxID=113226 RepID=A0A139IV61_9PEZI|nr:hypothetical protein AC579_2306 [Pseudocercospora musae]
MPSLSNASPYRFHPLQVQMLCLKKVWKCRAECLFSQGSLQAIPDALEGQVISITGGASGLGLALGRLLAQRGVILSIADITEKGIG